MKKTSLLLRSSAGVLLLLTACGGSAVPLPPRPPVVNVSMREFRFDFNHNIPRGRVVMHVVNTGRLAHRLSLVYVPKDFPPILRQLNGTERRNVDTLAAIPNRPPHAKDTFSVDLDPGRWAFICYRVEPDGTAHWQKGMAEEFIVP